MSERPLQTKIVTVTPDDEARIRELPKLIADEKLGKLITLAAELERLLTLRLNAKKTPLIVNEKHGS